jgi:hypothetical protein
MAIEHLLGGRAPVLLTLRSSNDEAVTMKVMGQG